MKTISQDNTSKTTSMKVFEKEPSNNDFFDEYSTPMYAKQDKDLLMMGFETIEPIQTPQPQVITMFSTPQQSLKSTIDSKTSKIRNKYKTYENDEAQKKFGNAKSISSQQMHGMDGNGSSSSYGDSVNLSRFEGSNSISSSDLFGQDLKSSSNRGRNKKKKIQIFY